MPTGFLAAMLAKAPSSLPLFFAGEVLLYFSALLAVWAMARRAPASPGRRAVGHAFPIAVVVVLAMASGRAEVALGVIFGTSVAALSSIAGFLGMVGPIGPGPQRWRRLWPFALAAALLAFIIGLGGLLSWQGAVALVTEGLVVLSLWRDDELLPESSAAESDPPAANDRAPGLEVESRGRRELPDPRPAVPPAPGYAALHAPASYSTALGSVLDYSPDRSARGTAGAFLAPGAAPAAGQTAVPSVGARARGRWVGPAVVLAAVLMAGAGAWAAVHGAVQFSRQGRRLPAAASAATLLSIALALPMVYTGRPFAARRQSWVPMTAHVGVVFINLCALLPLVAFWPYLAAVVPGVKSLWPPLLDWSARPPATPLVYPLPVWRIDTLLLVVLSLLHLPVSLGKWTLAREECFGLIVGYCVYVMAVMATSHAAL